MDLEGADSQLRGQDDTAFEKQSALFALAVADILLINTWARDFGREHGAIRPLLRTIFQEAVNMPEFHPRKTTLFLVVRDMSPHDPPLLKESAEKDIKKIWEEAPKPRGHEDAPLDKFFNVEIFALYDFRERKEEFEGQVEEVRKKYLISEYRQRILNTVSDEDRQRILNSVSDEDRQQILNSISNEDRRGGVVPASGFCLSIKDKWATIKRNKSLDLPAHMVMVATTRCDQIAEEKLGLFKSNQVWRGLQEAAEISFDAGFGAKISPILNESLSEYDSETLYYNEDVRNSKREYLKSGILMLVHPAYIKNLGHLRSEQFQSFKTQLQAHDSERFAESARRFKESCVAEFDRRCSEAGVEEARWDDDASTKRQELVRDIESHTLVVADKELPQVVNNCQDRLSRNLNRMLRTLLRASEEISLAGIRRAISEAESELRSAVESFELEQTEVDKKVNDIRQYGRALVENYLRDLKDEGVVKLMKERYILSLFAQSHPHPHTQRQTTANEDSSSSAHHQTACRESLKILSVMAAIRLDEGDDNIESVLVSALMQPADGGVQPRQDPLDASEWPQLPPQAITLITPTECKDIWKDFTDEMGDLFSRAHTVREEIMSTAVGNSWVPPTWVIVGMTALGIAGFLLFLRFTNLDLVLLVLKAAAEGLKIIGAGAAIYRNARDFFGDEGVDFDGFRRKHSDLMKSLKKYLKKLYDNLMNQSSTSISQHVAIEVAA